MTHNEIEDLKAELLLLKEQMQELKSIIQPISDTYKTVGRLGSWAKVLLAILASAIAAAYYFWQLFKNK